MTGLETTREYDSDAAWMVLAALCCPPFGIYHYAKHRNTKWICPECKETIEVGAQTCANCRADITQYVDEDA